jgi:predicted transcriptional regulator
VTHKQRVLEAVRELPDDCSIDDIAERVEFLAAVQKGFDQLDQGQGVSHDEVKRQVASWLTK